MSKKIQNRFFANYILMFLISTMVAIFAFLLMGFANDVISKTLVKNNYTAKSLMMDDYRSIDTTEVVENGGGVQVVNTNYQVVLSDGINPIPKSQLSIEEFTEFLIMSRDMNVPFSHSIEYNSKGDFWLIVSFPTSLRISFAVVYNKNFPSVDKNGVIGVFVAVAIFYLLLLALSTLIYSKITSIGIINPLKKLHKSALSLKNGDYSTRVNLNSKDEFGELEIIFNEMAQQIEKEIDLRMQSEENRKKLILDISHDLKNPLASIMGYTELCLNKPDIQEEERQSYMRVVYENSLRANGLIESLFELSKIESSEYTINKTKVDICEFMRKEMGTFIETFDKHGIIYDIDIPEKEIFLELDLKQMGRVFQNLISNAVTYNPEGTRVTIRLFQKADVTFMIFKDNGIGMDPELAKIIFNPFVRADSARNSKSGGTGLGLAIVEKIIIAHGGSISLKTEENRGCEFIIKIPNSVTNTVVLSN